MAERLFQCLMDARVFAKDTAISTKSVTKIFNRDGLWVVEGKTVSSNQALASAEAPAISDVDVPLLIAEIRSKLAETEHIAELMEFLDTRYKKITAAMESTAI